jgi:hypothetical protein
MILWICEPSAALKELKNVLGEGIGRMLISPQKEILTLGKLTQSRQPELIKKLWTYCFNFSYALPTFYLSTAFIKMQFSSSNTRNSTKRKRKQRERILSFFFFFSFFYVCLYFPILSPSRLIFPVSYIIFNLFWCPCIFV